MPKNETDFLSESRINLLRAKGKSVVKDKSKTCYIGQTAKDLRDKIVEKHYNAICDTFEIPKNDLELFKQATEGSGNEWMEINQLNSSTLLAFLCFHNVSQKQKFKFDGDEYSEVYFEVQSPLKPRDGKATAPSNMDVVLLTEDHKKALFLESKFTEYLSSKKPEVSTYYSRPYEALFGKDLTIECRTENGDDLSFSIKDSKWVPTNRQKRGQGLYLEGLKQMVSHYLGVLHCTQENDSEKFTGGASLWKVLSKVEEIQLGSILYRFENSKFDRYEAIYKKLMERIGDHSKKETKGRIKIIKDILRYQDVFAESENKSLLDEKVSKFYFE